MRQIRIQFVQKDIKNNYIVSSKVNGE